MPFKKNVFDKENPLIPAGLNSFSVEFLNLLKFIVQNLTAHAISLELGLHFVIF